MMHTMSGVLDADLWNLFRPRQPSEAGCCYSKPVL